MTARQQNEKKFRHWEEWFGAARRYIREIPGRAGGIARYIKEVDATEAKMRCAQEIYDPTGRLVIVHEMFPTDSGHKEL